MASERRGKHGAGERKSADGGGSTLLKGCNGDAAGGRGRGPGVVATWRAGTGKREGGSGRGVGQRSGAASGDSD
jgi:hypothetical protein